MKCVGAGFTELRVLQSHWVLTSRSRAHPAWFGESLHLAELFWKSFFRISLFSAIVVVPTSTLVPSGFLTGVLTG